MRISPVTRPGTVAETAAFDPFGEPVAAGMARDCAGASGDRTARRIGGAVFWGLALLILAGRIYATDLTPARTVLAQAATSASALVQAAALR